MNVLIEIKSSFIVLITKVQLVVLFFFYLSERQRSKQTKQVVKKLKLDSGVLKPTLSPILWKMTPGNVFIPPLTALRTCSSLSNYKDSVENKSFCFLSMLKGALFSSSFFCVQNDCTCVTVLSYSCFILDYFVFRF